MSDTAKQDAEAFDADMDKMEAEYRATLSPGELRVYRLWSMEIIDECPECGTKDADISRDTGPDMLGSWWQTKCEACNTVIESGATGTEDAK